MNLQATVPITEIKIVICMELLTVRHHMVKFLFYLGHIRFY